MNQKINRLTICYILFLILLLLSGILDGVFSRVVYLLAAAIPTVICLFRSREEVKRDKWLYLGIKKEGIRFTLPLIAPTIGLIMTVSFITSLLIFKLTGKENNVNVGDSFPLAMLNHALLPALVEEILFRYLPMRLLSSHSRRATVLASALFFSLIHQSLLSIPYAFVAGVIFMAIDLVADSIIPSFILHFINNSISIAFIMYGASPGFTPWALGILVLLCLISLIIIAIKRREYLKMLKFAFSKGESMKFSLELAIFSALMLFMAIINLL